MCWGHSPLGDTVFLTCEGASYRLGRTKTSEEGIGSFQQGHFQRSLEINVGGDICLNRDAIIV